MHRRDFCWRRWALQAAIEPLAIFKETRLFQIAVATIQKLSLVLDYFSFASSAVEYVCFVIFSWVNVFIAGVDDLTSFSNELVIIIFCDTASRIETLPGRRALVLSLI